MYYIIIQLCLVLSGAKMDAKKISQLIWKLKRLGMKMARECMQEIAGNAQEYLEEIR